MKVELASFAVSGGNDDDDDAPNAIAWGMRDGIVQVSPELKGSEVEIQAAVQALNDVLNAAKARAKTDKED
jgi:hypothetical protein